MAEAFSVLRDLKLPVNGYAMDVGLVEFSPVREVFSLLLVTTWSLDYQFVSGLIDVLAYWVYIGSFLFCSAELLHIVIN
ncbi:hypothetical protein Bca52824_071221 [Brassica carinata]|uniref:Uncharacterized protein n=1 Tax=Brassica carinata TaxID=52824 RepID=A0A8X7Q6B0_BRACI|nr:hypothetical protein Bca52824_071221 [Brassica carinata]